MASVLDTLKKHRERLNKIQNVEQRKKIKRTTKRPWQEKLEDAEAQAKVKKVSRSKEKKDKEELKNSDTIVTQKRHSSDTIVTQKRHNSDTKVTQEKNKLLAPANPENKESKSSDTIVTQKRHNSDTVVTQRGHSTDTVKTQKRHISDTVVTQRRHSSDTNSTWDSKNAPPLDKKIEHRKKDSAENPLRPPEITPSKTKANDSTVSLKSTRQALKTSKKYQIKSNIKEEVQSNPEQKEQTLLIEKKSNKTELEQNQTNLPEVSLDRISKKSPSKSSGLSPTHSHKAETFVPPINKVHSLQKSSDTVVTQTRHSSDTKPDTIGTQSRHNSDTVETQWGHKRRHSSDTKMASEKAEKAFNLLRGLKWQLMQKICTLCLENKTTGLKRITYASLAQMAEIPTSSIKTTLKRLRNDELLTIVSITRGPGAFVDIDISEGILDFYVSQHLIKSSDTVVTQTRHSSDTSSDTNGPSSSSYIYNNINNIYNNKTTTTSGSLRANKILPSGIKFSWEHMDIAPLESFGFHRGKLDQIIKRQIFSGPEELQQSIDYLAHYLRSDESQGIKDPLSWLMKQLNSGPFTRPRDFAKPAALEKAPAHSVDEQRKDQHEARLKKKLEERKKDAWRKADQERYKKMASERIQEDFGPLTPLMVENKAQELFFKALEGDLE